MNGDPTLAGLSSSFRRPVENLDGQPPWPSVFTQGQRSLSCWLRQIRRNLRESVLERQDWTAGLPGEGNSRSVAAI
jgi:hypothetical protein